MIRRSRNFQHINNNKEDIRPLIVIAKDDALSLKLTCDVLQSRGYRTLAVTNSRMIIEAAIHHCPDLVLIDVDSPSITVNELVKKMIKDPQLKDTPILIVKNENYNPDDELDIYIESSASTRQLVDRIELEITKAKKQQLTN